MLIVGELVPTGVNKQGSFLRRCHSVDENRNLHTPHWLKHQGFVNNYRINKNITYDSINSKTDSLLGKFNKTFPGDEISEHVADVWDLEGRFKHKNENQGSGLTTKIPFQTNCLKRVRNRRNSKLKSYRLRARSASVSNVDGIITCDLHEELEDARRRGQAARQRLVNNKRKRLSPSDVSICQSIMISK